MDKLLDVQQSLKLANGLPGKPKSSFQLAAQAMTKVADAQYVQGFLVCAGGAYQPIEHCWLETTDRRIDPWFSRLNCKPEQLYYFPAQQLTAQALQAAISEAEEDYPEDDPLPIYGAMPYEYYGDLMIGGQAYLQAHQAATAQCRQLNAPKRKAAPASVNGSTDSSTNDSTNGSTVESGS
jgi:hypothetical protein